MTVGPSSLLSPLVVLVRIRRSIGLPSFGGSAQLTCRDRSPNRVTGGAGWPGTWSGVQAGLGAEKLGPPPVPVTASLIARDLERVAGAVGEAADVLGGRVGDGAVAGAAAGAGDPDHVAGDGGAVGAGCDPLDPHGAALPADAGGGGRRRGSADDGHRHGPGDLALGRPGGVGDRVAERGLAEEVLGGGEHHPATLDLRVAGPPGGLADGGDAQRPVRGTGWRRSPARRS